MNQQEQYIPALGIHGLTRFYDPLMRRILHEDTFRRRLVDLANIKAGQRILDLGCGTGTLTILLKLNRPDATVVGLDPDPRVLAIAREKALRSGADISLDQGFANQLPYSEDSFDTIISSLVVHHLTRVIKERMMTEVYRCLRPAGELLIMDFGPPRGAYSHLVSPVMRRMERAADNIDGLLPGVLRNAGFLGVEELGHFNTIFGTLAFLRGRKPTRINSGQPAN